VIPHLAVAGNPLVEPSLAQRFAEELVVDLVRRKIDVIGLLELEREVLEALGGTAPEAGDASHVTPLSVLATALIDQAFRRVEAEWREGRRLAENGDCVCCVMERQDVRRRKGGLS
jgi:hypothetical protein